MKYILTMKYLTKLKINLINKIILNNLLMDALLEPPLIPKSILKPIKAITPFYLILN
jgi:hypothetical protein